jgi:O-antigen/teichoic acid export membrane protein
MCRWNVDSVRREDVIADTDEIALDLLRTPEAGGRVVRGGLIRGAGFALSTGLGLATAILLLRHLGVVDFGRYATVMAILGIVGGVTDAGLTAVGSRELSVAPTTAERNHTLNNLLLLRVLGASLGVVAAVGFTVLAGYEGTVIAGTIVGGVGLVLISAQSMLTVPIWVGLRIASLTALEVLRNLLTLAGVAILVSAGAGLLAFFGVQIAVAVVLIPVTLVLARVGVRFATGVRRATVMRLLRETLPLAVAFAMSVIYFRVLVVLVSLLSTETQTGLFGTSFRIFEMLIGLPTLILSVALPLLSVAGDEDDPRLRRGLQSMTEASLLIASILVVGIAILAEPGIRLIGGEEYLGAASVLRIQALALVPLFLVQTWQLGLIAGRAQRALAVANGLALAVVLVLGLALVPSGGAEAAAWVAVAAESSLALFLWIALGRMGPGRAPSLRVAWKVAVAAGLAAGVGYLLRDLPIIAACVATLVFAVVAFAMRAVPPDLYYALGFRWGEGDDETEDEQ